MKKILAVLLACSMLFAFAACGGNNEETTTAAPETTTEAIAEETTAAADETTAPAEETTAAAEETTVAGEETTAAAVPATTEEIVAYFNTAINSAKKDSKSIHSNYMKHAVAGEVTGVPGIIDKVLGGTGNFIDGFMGEDKNKANVTWSSAADKNAFFPVENETWASKLTAANVKSASCTPSADGKTYTIKITTKADGKSSTVKHGDGNAPKAFNVVLPAIIDENIPGAVAKLFSIGTVEMNYPSSTVVVKVDAETGKVLTANYMLYWTINIPLGDTVVVLPFSTENDYVINW